WFGDAVVWPSAIAILGALTIWLRSDPSESSRVRRVAASVTVSPLEAIVAGRSSRSGVLIGAALTVAGTAAFLAANTSLESLGNLIFPVAVTIAGLGLILGPWVARLTRQASDERQERVRSQERSEMAAHLHDSVLQTLALIQRTESPRRMVSLARTQERELRAWLYDRTGDLDEESMRTAFDALAGKIEQTHLVRVETVVVGDAPMDDRTRALVKACGEAINNAARHAGSQEISVYVEANAQEVIAYVRDEGVGFDVDAIPEDRHGIRESICARMERIGGAATISSTTGEGTEVQLRMARMAP
ncbi:MAG TPA: ATP-binding protein, partial [Actinomycetota bacterium]|nr:ATP-binding protein [Actinomycetota bacterium]